MNKQSSDTSQPHTASRLLGTAAKLARNKAAQAQITSIALPRVYHAIGKSLMMTDALPADLAEIRTRIRSLEDSKTNQAQPRQADDPTKLAARLSQLTSKVSKAASDAKAGVQAQMEYARFGKLAAERYGAKIVSAAYMQEIADLTAKLGDLSAEATALESGRPRGMPSFRTIAIAVAAGCILLAFVTAALRGRSPARPQKPAVARVNERQESAAADRLPAAKDLQDASELELESSLTPEQADVLVATGQPLNPSVRSLTPQVAAVLARCPADLDFVALEELDVATAAALASHVGGPCPTGLRPRCSALTINLKSIPDGVADALARHQGDDLMLGGDEPPIPRISTYAAKAISKYRGRSLSLQVAEIDREAQDALASFKGSLSMTYLTNITSPALLDKLIKSAGDELALSVRSLSVEQAKRLASLSKEVNFLGMEEVPVDVARILAGGRARIHFSRLDRCTPEVRRILLSNKGISLNE